MREDKHWQPISPTAESRGTDGRSISPSVPTGQCVTPGRKSQPHQKKKKKKKTYEQPEPGGAVTQQEVDEAMTVISPSQPPPSISSRGRRCSCKRSSLCNSGRETRCRITVVIINGVGSNAGTRSRLAGSRRLVGGAPKIILTSMSWIAFFTIMVLMGRS